MVDVAVFEEIFHEPLAALVKVVLVGPDLGLRAKITVVVVKAWMNCLLWTLRWFSGRASQSATCASRMK